jgi:hypothetical protein
MPSLLWDASALVKRYFLEVGSDIVGTLFRLADLPPMFVTISGFAETFAILVRKRNERLLDGEGFRAATRLLNDDIFGNGIIKIVNIEYRDVLNSLPLIETHNLNSSDAAILTSYTRYITDRPGSYLLSASDRRLLRAASADGFQTLNPETVNPVELPHLVRRLS